MPDPSDAATGRRARSRTRILAAAAALAFGAMPLVAAGSAAGAGAQVPQGLIAVRDAQGVGLVDPATGAKRLLLSLPAACTASIDAPAAIMLAGPVWAPSAPGGPMLYLWLTDWEYSAAPHCALPLPPAGVTGRAILLALNPITGAMRAVAAAPEGLPCQPGEDIAATGQVLAFTDDGCDEPSVQALKLPLRVAESAVTAPAVAGTGLSCSDCVIAHFVLGPGAHGLVLMEEAATQVPHPPPPVLGWFDPGTGTVGAFAHSPPASVRPFVAAAAASPSGDLLAFAAGRAGAGLLDMANGDWSQLTLPACAGHCPGAASVSFAPNGQTLAVAANGSMALVAVTGGGAPRSLLRGAGVVEVSWSSVTVAGLQDWTRPAATLSSVLAALWQPFAHATAKERESWQVVPPPAD